MQDACNRNVGSIPSRRSWDPSFPVWADQQWASACCGLVFSGILARWPSRCRFAPLQIPSRSVDGIPHLTPTALSSRSSFHLHDAEPESSAATTAACTAKRDSHKEQSASTNFTSCFLPNCPWFPSLCSGALREHSSALPSRTDTALCIAPTLAIHSSKPLWRRLVCYR